jgi:hypothetical protein
MFKPTFFVVLCGFLIHLLIYLSDIENKDTSQLMKSPLTLLFYLIWACLQYKCKSVVPMVIFFKVAMTCLVENMVLRETFLVESNHLELSGFSILESLIIFATLNSCPFVVTLIALPIIIVLPYYFSMVAYA